MTQQDIVVQKVLALRAAVRNCTVEESETIARPLLDEINSLMYVSYPRYDIVPVIRDGLVRTTVVEDRPDVSMCATMFAHRFETAPDVVLMLPEGQASTFVTALDMETGSMRALNGSSILNIESYLNNIHRTYHEEYTGVVCHHSVADSYSTFNVFGLRVAEHFTALHPDLDSDTVDGLWLLFPNEMEALQNVRK